MTSITSLQQISGSYSCQDLHENNLTTQKTAKAVMQFIKVLKLDLFCKFQTAFLFIENVRISRIKKLIA